MVAALALSVVLFQRGAARAGAAGGSRRVPRSRSQGPEGAGFDYTVEPDAAGRADSLAPTIGEDKPIQRVNTRVPGGFGASEEMHTGQAIVFLQDWDERDVTTAEVVEELRAKLGTMPGVRATPQVRRRPRAQHAGSRCRSCSAGPTTRSSRSGATACSRAWSRTRACSARIPTTRKRGRRCASRSTATAPPTSACRSRRSARTLETMMGSRRVTTFVEDGEEYDVVLQAGRAGPRARRPTSRTSTCARAQRRAGAAVEPGDADASSPSPAASTASTACARSRCQRGPRARLHARRGDRLDASRRARRGAAGPRADRLQGRVARVPARPAARCCSPSRWRC